MSPARWSIARAKAGLSRLVEDARERPQVIENRGRPVAVVLAATEYERMRTLEQAGDRWTALLDLSAEIRSEGGATLKTPRRRPRRSPLARG